MDELTITIKLTDDGEKYHINLEYPDMSQEEAIAAMRALAWDLNENVPGFLTRLVELLQYDNEDVDEELVKKDGAERAPESHAAL